MIGSGSSCSHGLLAKVPSPRPIFSYRHNSSRLTSTFSKFRRFDYLKLALLIEWLNLK